MDWNKEMLLNGAFSLLNIFIPQSRGEGIFLLESTLHFVANQGGISKTNFSERCYCIRRNR